MIKNFKRKHMGKRILAGILLLATALAVYAIAQKRPERAMAANEMYVEGIGYVTIAYSGVGGYDIYLDKQKNLIVVGQYYSDSSATLSYHTGKLFFATEDRDCNPTNGKYFPVDVTNHNTIPVGGNLVLDTYTVPRAKLETMITNLYDREALETEQTVYMSEGFYLKERPSASIPWSSSHIKMGTLYSSLNEILGAANWSGTTKENFENYYDIELTLNLAKYDITVEAGDGGTVSQSDYDAYEGDDVTVRAFPEDDYNFAGWTVVEGTIPGFDSGAAVSTFSMPSCDIAVKANFTAKEKPPATKAPVATPTDGPTPTEGPTPTPEPTPKPTYMPSESSEQVQVAVRYYSTDAGYSIGGIYNRTVTPQDDAFGYVGTDGADNKAYRFEELTSTSKGGRDYDVGTDDMGNTWYFMADGSNATYVHPKEYNGYIVDSADVRYITELTFPETITYSGAAYTVTSIGGGTDKYTVAGSYDNSPNQYNEWGMVYNNYETYVSETYTGEGLRSRVHIERLGRVLGVIGNGEIISEYWLHQFYSNSTYMLRCYENSYYVYNTTLKYVTIPDTVTKIEEYAFYGCQALEKIMGGDNVTDIGDHSFATSNTPALTKSVAKQDSSGSINTFEYYYYNGSFTFDTPTSTMLAWKNSVVLSNYMEFPAFDLLKNLGVSSFEKRKNLFDVTLPTGVTKIGANAFKECELERITVPSKDTEIDIWLRPSISSRLNATPEQTLGTKGSAATTKTLIVTELNAKAMDYGITYDEYYDVRAGYDVIYHSNSTPAETYVTKPRIVKNYTTLMERYPLSSWYGFSNSALPEERYYTQEVLLDADGGLYIAESYNIPVRQLPEQTFNNIYTFALKSGSSTTTYGYDSVGYPVESTENNYTTNYCCLAYADDGTVYLYQTNTEEWVDLGIPAGSTNFAPHKNSYGDGDQGGSYMEETYTLYYIDNNGGLFKKQIYFQTEESSYYTEGTTTYYSYTLNRDSVSSVSLPSGVSAVKRFCLNNENTANPGFPPEINIEDSSGGTWTSSYGNWSASDTYIYTPIGYMEYQEELAIYTDRGITDFGPRLVGYNQIATLYDLMFDAQGKEFLGWCLRADGTGVIYQPGQEIRITAPTTLYAKWGGDGKAKKIIQYLPNGGIGIMEDDVYSADEPNPVTLKKNSFIRKGYGFVGWSYKAEPGHSDVILQDEATVVIGLGITKLYAQWAPVTYTVRVGSDDMRVTEQLFNEHILELDEELTLGTKEDKLLTISYDLNDKETQPSMHAKAEFVSELTEQNTEAFLDFYGWYLYEDVNKDEKITEDDKYVGYYESGSVLKNLATKKDAMFYAFPYWGGSASYVRLPEIICDGYMFVGYTSGVAYMPDYFETSEAFERAIRENILIPAPVGSGARYQPKADGEILYAYYEREMQESDAYGFEVYDIYGMPAWEEIRDMEYNYTIGVPDDDSDLWDTLPLRTGIHPIYRNLGGLPMGGGFSFQVVSTGSFAEENTILTIIPYLCPVGEEGYYDGDLYFEQETDRGCFLKKWQPEEQAIMLYADKDSTVVADGGSRIWTGTFRVPENLWTAEPNTNVKGYQQQFGLNFEEPFWIKDARLMLRFTLCFASEDGELLYYGMLPEDAEENAWVQEAGESYREDYDKNRYNIFGGEVAVIYPGDSVERWNQIHGIY